MFQRYKIIIFCTILPLYIFSQVTYQRLSAVNDEYLQELWYTQRVDGEVHAHGYHSPAKDRLLIWIYLNAIASFLQVI